MNAANHYATPPTISSCCVYVCVHSSIRAAWPSDCCWISLSRWMLKSWCWTNLRSVVTATLTSLTAVCLGLSGWAGTRNECTDKPSRPFDRTLIYFTSAAVSVGSSHMTALSCPLHGVDSVHLIIFLLMGTCRQWGSWSVGGHNHWKVIARDPICAS